MIPKRVMPRCSISDVAATSSARPAARIAAVPAVGCGSVRERVARPESPAGECQSLVFKHGVQLFGAMGFTWENDVQFALKRAKAGELMLGGAAEHRAFVTETSLAQNR